MLGIAGDYLLWGVGKVSNGAKSARVQGQLMKVLEGSRRPNSGICTQSCRNGEGSKRRNMIGFAFFNDHRSGNHVEDRLKWVWRNQRQENQLRSHRNLANDENKR